MCVVGSLTIALAIACGVLVDLGFSGTAWACGVMAVVCFLMLAPTAELFDSE
jgi:hypothetical protein